jgi:hypothetical protein
MAKGVDAHDRRHDGAAAGRESVLMRIGIIRINPLQIVMRTL